MEALLFGTSLCFGGGRDLGSGKDGERTQGVTPRARADPGSQILIYFLRCASCSASCTQRKALTLLEGFPSHGGSPWSLPSSLQEQQEQGLPAQRGSDRIPAAPKSLSWSTRAGRAQLQPGRIPCRRWHLELGVLGGKGSCLLALPCPFSCSPPWFVWNPRQAERGSRMQLCQPCTSGSCSCDVASDNGAENASFPSSHLPVVPTRLLLAPM